MLASIAGLALLPAWATAHAKSACTMLETDGGVARVHVELSASEPEKAYCISVQKGQLLRAAISNPQGVHPAGRVISPAGEMDGGPGGPFYRGETRQSGTYTIVAGQRGHRRAGSYDLTIELRPPHS